MKEKYTWNMVREDFRKSYPELSRESNYWHPHDFMSIMVYLNNGKTIIFDDTTKKIKYSDPWKEDADKKLS